MSKLGHITIATDLSPQSAVAVERGLSLARQHGSSVLALSVVPPVTPSLELEWLRRQQLSPEEVKAQLHTETKNRLQRAVADAGAGVDVPVTVQVREGRHPHIEIACAAHGVDSDLVVTGAHGGHFVHRLLVGTTAERVVRRADRPVLVVKQPVSGEYRTVLVPTDFSGLSEAALQFARQAVPQARFSLIHAYEFWFENWIGLGHGVDEPALELLEEIAAQARGWLAELMQRQGLDRGDTRQLVRYGYPGRIITSAAQELDVDLIVMGTHGRSTFEQVMLGSVAEHVLRECRCDVLLVPPHGRPVPSG